MNNQKTYADKLRDPRWQRKRLEIMQRDNFRCIACGNDKDTLQVHHIKYHKDTEPWEYKDSNFETLCEKCHQLNHSKSQKKEPTRIDEIIRQMDIKPNSLLGRLRQELLTRVSDCDYNISSYDELRKAWIAYIGQLTIQRKVGEVNVYSTAFIRFIRENYFVIIVKSSMEQKVIEADKLNLLGFLNKYFNNSVSFLCVIDEN